MKKAVCPGSFCPVTNGHIDIFRRAAELFDEVTVLVMTNPEKHYDFSVEERCNMISCALSGNNRIKVDAWDGLLAEYVEKNGINAIVKGLRQIASFGGDISDFVPAEALETIEKVLKNNADI